MWLGIFITALLALVVMWLVENCSDEEDDCGVCCVGMKKSSLTFINLKEIGWTIACSHCIKVHGVDETSEGKVISIAIPYWISQPAQTKA